MMMVFGVENAGDSSFSFFLFFLCVREMERDVRIWMMEWNGMGLGLLV